MIEEKIYYKKVRDLGAIFSATFGFIKKNFKPFYGGLLFFAGPVLLLGAAISSFMLGSSLGMTGLIRGGIERFYGNFIVTYFTTLLVMFIGISVYNVILNRNIIENEKLLPGEPLTIKHGIANFWPDFWKMLGNSFFLILTLIISMVIIILVFAGIFALNEGGVGSGAIFFAVLGVILVFAFLLIFGPILAFIPMAAIFVSQRDDVGIFVAIRKVLYYMKDNFWNTWIVSFVGLLTYFILGAIVQIPAMIITMFTTFSRYKSTIGYGIEDQSTPLMLVIVTAISSLLSHGILVIYHLIAIYQYTNLEEKKEGSSILDKINQIQ